MKLDTLKTIESALNDAIVAEGAQMHALWRWKLDLESAWEEFTEKDWR